MGNETKQKFDGYANQYDEWFMVNDKLFTSELKLFQKVLGDITGKRLLSVGCGSGCLTSITVSFTPMPAVTRRKKRF